MAVKVIRKYTLLSTPVIASGGTPQRLSASSLEVGTVLLEAPTANSGSVFVGSSSAGVLAGDYNELSPGEAMELSVEGDYSDDDIVVLDLTDIWIDGTTSDELKVAYFTQTSRQLT